MDYESLIENASINEAIEEPIKLHNGHPVSCDCSECDCHRSLIHEYLHPTCGGCGCSETACECPELDAQEEQWHIVQLESFTPMTKYESELAAIPF